MGPTADVLIFHTFEDCPGVLRPDDEFPGYVRCAECRLVLPLTEPGIVEQLTKLKP